MQRLIYTIIASFFFVVSCKDKTAKNILPEDKMSKLMTEISLVDAYINTLSIDSGKKVMPVLYEKTFKDFGIDSAIFVRNLNHYLGNPELTESLYKNVGDKLLAYESNFRIQDSIKTAFTQDSIRNASILYEQYRIQNSYMISYYADSTKYDRQNHINKYYQSLHIPLQVYGIQIPLQENTAAISPAVPAAVIDSAQTLDTIANKQQESNLQVVPAQKQPNEVRAIPQNGSPKLQRMERLQKAIQ